MLFRLVCGAGGYLFSHRDVLFYHSEGRHQFGAVNSQAQWKHWAHSYYAVTPLSVLIQDTKQGSSQTSLSTPGLSSERRLKQANVASPAAGRRWAAGRPPLSPQPSVRRRRRVPRFGAQPPPAGQGRFQPPLRKRPIKGRALVSGVFEGLGPPS